MLASVLDDRLTLGLIVVVGVPAVIVGYVILAERVLGRLPVRVGAPLRPWVWSLPAIAFVGVFLVFPTIATLWRSLLDRGGRDFVGLENYRWFFSTDDSLISLRNNLAWAIVLPFLVVGVGLVVAMLANTVRYEVTVRTILFLPMAISSVAAGVIWRLMYDFNANVGTLNAALGTVGVGPVPWLSAEPTNNLMLIIVGAWMLTGLAVVILSAGIKGIPVELLEAARLDGAGELTVFRRIIYPLLRPTLTVVVTTVVIFALKTFDVVYVMTSGRGGTEVVANQMYKQLFSFNQQGRASALAVVLLLATAPIMVANVRRFRQQEADR